MKFASAFVAAFGVVAVAALSTTAPVAQAAPEAKSCPAYLDQDFRKLHSQQTLNICKEYAGKPLLIVNTASHCGFTPQFKGLEAVNKKYKDRGLVMVGFASDDFNQEDKDEGKAAEICEQNYGVTFVMLSPTHVKGPEANKALRAALRAADSGKVEAFRDRADLPGQS